MGKLVSVSDFKNLFQYDHPAYLVKNDEIILQGKVLKLNFYTTQSLSFFFEIHFLVFNEYKIKSKVIGSTMYLWRYK